MIGVASTFFWIFLIGFAVSAAFSVKDLNISFGEPQTAVTADNKILFSLPIILTNNGLYSIRLFNMTTKISSPTGYNIAKGSTFVPAIKRNQEVVAYHNVTIDVADMLARNQNFLFYDTEFKIIETVSLKVAEVVPVKASLNYTMPWGAPLYNLAIGNPQFEAFNHTHMKASVPLGFENHAMFDLAGKVQARMYDDAGRLRSTGETALNVGQHSTYSGTIEFFVHTSSRVDVPASGYIEVSFQTQLFSYGSVRIYYE